ncbi:MAG: TetR/AcrR family transcriptional regulator, partial [Betaproteobacteria bacterium]
MTDETLRSVMENYLTRRHRDNPGGGCMFSSLASEAARQSGPVRAAFTTGLKPALDALGKIAPGRTRAARRRKAIAIMAEMVGAMVLARAVDDVDLSDEVLGATLQDL